MNLKTEFNNSKKFEGVQSKLSLNSIALQIYNKLNNSLQRPRNKVTDLFNYSFNTRKFKLFNKLGTTSRYIFSTNFACDV